MKTPYLGVYKFRSRPDVAKWRRAWQAAQPYIDPERLVFLDETGVNTKMTRLYGWSPTGSRCKDSAPFGHWKTMTFVAGLRLTGLTAPWVLDGPMNPIEMAFSKLKALLRQEPARTIDRLVGRIGTIVDSFKAAECANFFNAAGYQRSS